MKGMTSSKILHYYMLTKFCNQCFIGMKGKKKISKLMSVLNFYSPHSQTASLDLPMCFNQCNNCAQSFLQHHRQLPVKQKTQAGVSASIKTLQNKQLNSTSQKKIYITRTATQRSQLKQVSLVSQPTSQSENPTTALVIDHRHCALKKQAV